MPEKTFHILETPRDALQSIHQIIPVQKKASLLKKALNVGFDVVDVGSFVSPKVIPQFADMAEVLALISDETYQSKVFLLTGNKTGAQKAAQWDVVDYIGFPFSLSETFLKRNINITISEAWQVMQDISKICDEYGKQCWIYFSMAFGNPYGDTVSIEVMLKWAKKLSNIGVRKITLSDITAVSTPEQIAQIYQQLTSAQPEIDFGLHLHARPQEDYSAHLKAAWENGCSYFDGVTGGVGGCPMTGYEMLSNLPTSQLVDFAKNNKLKYGVDQGAFENYQTEALELFSDYS